jgi:Rap1a immunity proteins
MKLLASGLLAFFVLLTAPARATPDLTTGALRTDCSSEDVAPMLHCFSYINALFELMMLNGSTMQNKFADNMDVQVALTSSSVCYTDPIISPRELVQVFLNWADKNPEKWTLPRVVGVTDALREQWPCK